MKYSRFCASVLSQLYGCTAIGARLSDGVAFRREPPAGINLEFSKGNGRSKRSIVPVGQLGDISVYATDDTELIIDTHGYFAPAGRAHLILDVSAYFAS